MTMNSEAAVDSATGALSPSPRWVCAELLLAGALLVAGLTVQHVVFSAICLGLYLGLYPGITAG